MWDWEAGGEARVRFGAEGLWYFGVIGDYEDLMGNYDFEKMTKNFDENEMVQVVDEVFLAYLMDEEGWEIGKFEEWYIGIWSWNS